MDTVGELPYTESAKIFAEPDRPDAYRSHNVLLSDLDPRRASTPSCRPEASEDVRDRHPAPRRRARQTASDPERDRPPRRAVLADRPVARTRRTRARCTAHPGPGQGHVIGRLLNFSFGKLDPERRSPRRSNDGLRAPVKAPGQLRPDRAAAAEPRHLTREELLDQRPPCPGRRRSGRS